MDEDTSFQKETPKVGIRVSTSEPAPVPCSKPSVSLATDKTGSHLKAHGADLRTDGQPSSPPLSSTTHPLAIITARAYIVPGTGKIRFDLWKPTLERMLSMSLRDGKMYRISGRIEVVGEFQVRHSATKEDHVYVFVDPEQLKVMQGQRYRLVIESVKEDRRFEVVQTGKGPCIRIFRTVLESWGIRDQAHMDSVVEFVFRYSMGGRDGIRRAFGRYNSAIEWMQLYVSGLGVRVGDALEVAGARKYTVGDFVEDFEVHKSEGLRTVRLWLANCGDLELDVDGVKFAAREPRLTVHGLELSLKMKVGREEENGKEIKFELDGETITARMANSDLIREFRVTEGGGLRAVYSRAGRDTSYVCQLVSEQNPPHLMSITKFREWSKERVRVVSAPIGTIEGKYSLEVDEEFRYQVGQILRDAGNGFNRQKGTIGETLAWLLCPNMGMQVIVDHPLSTNSELFGSLRKGPDFLIQGVTNQRLYYLEVKWWADGAEEAERDAIAQVLGVYERKPVYHGERISGAFIVLVNWKVKYNVAILYVKEAKVN